MPRFALLFLLCLAAGAAHASDIDFDTRDSAAGPYDSAIDYENAVNALMAQAPTPGYGDANPASFTDISNYTVFDGPNTDIASRTVLTFDVTDPGEWNFRMGVDFGHGGAVFLDGAAVAWNPHDMWWNGAYSAGQSFDISALLAPGVHQILVYGIEDCCDGAMRMQFEAPGGRWTDFSTDDGLGTPSLVIQTTQADLPVPEPMTPALMGAGLVMLWLVRRRVGAR